MKNIRILSLIVFVLIYLWSCEKFEAAPDKPTAQELDEKFRDYWNTTKYEVANSGANEIYLTETEKRVFYYLNLARLNPEQFANTYVDSYKGEIGYSNHSDFESYKSTLITQLRNTKPLEIFIPNKELWELAQCHAIGIGQKGIRGHDRSITGCPSGYNAECISYGMHNSLEIAMQLLIDYGVTSLGHRSICLGEYKSLGVSIQNHKEYETCAVLDFYRTKTSKSIYLPNESIKLPQKIRQ